MAYYYLKKCFAVLLLCLFVGVFGTALTGRSKERPELAETRIILLTSGDHAAIRRWRRKQALGRTFERRPDLLADRELSPEDKKLLFEYQQHTKF